MGLFDKIKQKVGDAMDAHQTAYEQGMTQDIPALCATLKEAKGIELTGYKAAFKAKCEVIDSKELKKLYREVKRGLSLKKNHAADVIEDILVARGVATRNEDGTVSGI